MSAAPTFRESAATDEAAQAGLLYERYARQLQGFCRARLSSREEAEDAVQHTFLNAYRSLRKGTRPQAEAAWMFAIAANVCRERRRSAWRRSRIEVVSDDGLVGECAAPEHSHEELTGVADALAELTPNQRRAILMREWQGLSYREIAAELSLSEGAIETLLFRARRSLASKLDRSRGRVWALSNLGSALAWGKTLLGGTAAQVAAASVVVAAGMTAASPVHVHRSAQALAPKHTRTVSAVSRTVKAPVPVRAQTTTRATPHRAAPRTTAAPAPSTPSKPISTTVTVEQPTPTTAPPAAETPAPPATPPPAVAPAPQAPPVPQLPKVEVPPLPKVEVPPLPPLPPVNLPNLPLPDLPKLPKLP
jgi:RNA polymerase sigma-70 factor (ECF subfamily)